MIIMTFRDLIWMKNIFYIISEEIKCWHRKRLFFDRVKSDEIVRSIWSKFCTDRKCSGRSQRVIRSLFTILLAFDNCSSHEKSKGKTSKKDLLSSL